MEKAFIPVEAIPPGEFLQDELDARGWTQDDFATVVGLSRRQVVNLLQGKSGLTSEVAIAIGEAFDQDPRTWLNLQVSYELARAAREDREVRHRAKLYSKAPIKELIRRGWLPETDDFGVLRDGACRLLRIANLDETPSFRVAARKSTEYGLETAAQQAWYGKAMELGEAAPAGRFSMSRIDECIAYLVRMAAFPEDLRRVPRVLQDFGVAVVFVEHLKGTKIDGAAFQIGEKPVIAMSLRFDRMDNFWFTLLHEIVHIKRQDVSPVDVDLGLGDDADLPEMERIANHDAANYLIPTDKLESFIARKRPYYYRASVIQFAQARKVHPSIVVGQLQKRKELTYAQFRDLLPKVREHVVGQAITDGWGNCVSVGEKG